MEHSEFVSAPVPKAIVKFAVPTILSQLITLIYNLADTFFVGHTNDPNQVAALTLCFPIFMLLTAVGNLMGIGSNSLIARSLGSGNSEQAKRACVFGAYGSMLLAVILTIVIAVGMKPLLVLLGASANTYPYAASYLRWTMIYGGIPTVFSLVMGHLVRAEGNTKQASIGMSLGGIINIILDYLLVSRLGMGITGAAVATFLSNLLTTAYFVFLLLRNRDHSVITLCPSYFRFDRSIVSQVLFVGFPAALVTLLGCSANIVLTHHMAPYGDLNVAAFGVVQKIGTITIQITIGMTQGIMPLIGYNYACGNYVRTREINRDAFLILGCYAALCLLLIELFPSNIIRMFIPEEKTVSIGIQFLRRWILCAPGMCFVNMFNSVFQAIGKWKQSMLLTIFRQAALLIPLLILLNRMIGLYGLVWAQPISDTLSLLLGCGLYLFLLKTRVLDDRSTIIS